MNAFDVVRLHKFGDKDARAAEGTEPGKLPSFKAMQDFVSADEEVKNTLAKKDRSWQYRNFPQSRMRAGRTSGTRPQGKHQGYTAEHRTDHPQ